MDQNDDSYSPLPQPADDRNRQRSRQSRRPSSGAPNSDRLERRQKWLDRLPGILVFATVYLILILLYRPNLMLSQPPPPAATWGRSTTRPSS